MAAKKEKVLSVTETAQRMGVSRTYVLKLISTGKITAQKIGKTYVISEKSLPGIYRTITEAEKKSVERAVNKTMEEYGEVIKKLGET